MVRLMTPVLLLCYIYMSQVQSEQGFLYISSGLSHKEYCITYSSSWTNLSKSLGDAVEYPLVNLTSSTLCNISGPGPVVLKGKAVVVMRGGCEFVQKAVMAQDLGATTILIASKTPLVTPSSNDTDHREVKIPLALMRYRDTEDALEMFPEGMSVKLYAPSAPRFDVSILVMLAVGVFTVAMGGYWSGTAERDALCTSSALPPAMGEGGEGSREARAHGGDLAVSSPVKVVIFVVFMSAMLVLMFFFYKWLVYVIIVVFCLASALALYSCLNALLEKLGCTNSSIPCLGERASGIVRAVVLAAVCISVAVVWGVYRNEDRWIWVLQDLLGMAFCINFMKTITVSNFKICVILLSLLLVYDVFFVFITPLFTKNGQSIMVQVAVGTGSDEKLPMVMKVPRFSSWKQDACGIQFSILGFGDLIVPGLVVAYCHRFDVWTNSTKKIYFISCTIGYLSGLICTFIIMILSGMAQPALLYLVPFTLLTCTAVACHKHQLKPFWTGTRIGYEVLDSSRDPLLQDEGQEYEPIQSR
ncbi:signal peptide peptidase-like 2A isoform X1 [Anguilla anguilla]|uniref:PA domain-containing protein n=1 Tax=Anguilla anguilla TaxID=7936 RepID=A0A9D3LZZ1_ANGAN|nr:signal peptide peptidase-like 2A isoform X1 [Anguilla anguilla]KAG5839436.1 hypothetical protein ANANG_G00204940 [Anguilla anguilla]